MRNVFVASLFLALASSGCAAGASSSASPSILPLKTLRLYETGIAYFERAGSIGSSEAMTLPVPAGHLDDALKTLVVLSHGSKERIHGVEFGSNVSAAMARSLAGLPQQADAISYEEVLASLKGAHVVIARAGKKIEGRIVDLTAHARSGAPSSAANDELTLFVMSDAGELERIEARDVSAVRPTDPAFATRLGAALDALSPRAAQSERRLRLMGARDEAVSFGYIAEAPIWRASYRMVFANDATNGTLQAWALLHNDTDENWRGVHTELVNGHPDSFLFPLAAPRYGRRQLVHPDVEVSTVPQLADTTADRIWGDHLDATAENEDASAPWGVGEGGGGRGEGIGIGSIGTIGHGGARPSEVTADALAETEGAKGVESGALFTYALAEPLDLRAHGSALVPFLQQTIDARAITRIAMDREPRSAVRFVNTTTQTLPPGTIAFFRDGGFAGESTLDRTKPQEIRFVEYAAELDVALTKSAEQKTLVPTKVSIVNDELQIARTETTHVTYTLENRSGHAQTVYADVRGVASAKVEGADETDAQAPGPIAVFHLAPRSKVEKPLTVTSSVIATQHIDYVGTAAWLELAASTTLSAKARAVLAEAAGKSRELEETKSAVDAAEKDVRELNADLLRYREHLKSLGGDKGNSAAPIVTRMLAAEDRLAAKKKVVEAEKATQKAREDALRGTLGKLGG